MALVHCVIALALVEYLWFCFAVGRARARFGVKAPAVSGHEGFERYYRVQMNTLELLVAFLPGIVLFAHYVSARWAAALGGAFLVGRAWYFFVYVREPARREYAFALSLGPVVILVVGGLVGVALRAVTG